MVSAYAEQVDSDQALKFFVDFSEPLIWVVASLFTEQFLEKPRPFSFTNSYKNFDEYHSAIQAFIENSPDVLTCLKKAQKALQDGVIQPHIRIPDEWGDYWEPEFPVKVVTFSFYLWAENNSYIIPQSLMPNLELLAQSHYHANAAFEQQEYKFPAITREQFLERCKEPLWRVSTGILYLLGRRARGNQEEDFIKANKLAQKIQKYLYDAYKIGKVRLVFQEPALADFLSLDDVLLAEIEPEQLISFAKGLPFALAIFEEKLPAPSQQPKVLHYNTQEMALMTAAVERFWSNYDLNQPDPNKAPLKKDVIKWLRDEAKNRGFEISANIGKVMDTIIRCPKARKGGNSL